MQQPDTEDYKKPSRVMKCLQVIIGLPLILSIKNKARNIKWYVNAVFSVHKYMRNPNRDFMNMRIGAAFSKSSKKKLTQIVQMLEAQG